MIIRLYTGDEDQAHFEDLNVPAGETQTVSIEPGVDMNFRRSPDGSFSDWHNAPWFQYVIVLSPVPWATGSRPACHWPVNLTPEDFGIYSHQEPECAV